MPAISSDRLAALTTRLRESDHIRTDDLDVSKLADRVSDHVLTPVDLSDVVSNRGFDTGGSASDFATMKARVAMGCRRWAVTSTRT